MTRTRRSGRLLLVAALTLPTMLAAACGSTAPTTASSTAVPSSVAVTTAQAVAAASTTTSTGSPSSDSGAGALSGHWSGSYSGDFSGTFELTWVESSDQLKGTINLSTSGTLPLNGTVKGSEITFGTVGSTKITYTGTVSGDTMSGTYVVAGSQHGDWKATRA
jgi:hypothetical protein